MHCCGKCMLKKKLAEQEEQQKLPVFPDIKTDFTLIIQAHQFFKIYQDTFTPLYELSVLFTQREITGVFHPPCC